MGFWKSQVMQKSALEGFIDQVLTKTQNLFKGLVIGIGPKGMPGRMSDIVR